MDAAVSNNSVLHHNISPPPPSPPPSARYSSSEPVKEPAEYYAKYRSYERDYLRRINHKYFSGKKIAGTGRVFETITTVDGFTIKESSEPPIKRFLDLPSSREEQHSHSGAPLPLAKKPPRRKS